MKKAILLVASVIVVGSLALANEPQCSKCDAQNSGVTVVNMENIPVDSLRTFLRESGAQFVASDYCAVTSNGKDINVRPLDSKQLDADIENQLKRYEKGETIVITTKQKGDPSHTVQYVIKK
jgi:hypothetical protein